MDCEEALAVVDAAVFAVASRHLSEPEVRILQGAWQGQTYEQMAEASQYRTNYLMRDVGPKLWKLLTEVLGEEIGKTNFRVVMERQRSLGQVPKPHLDRKTRSETGEAIAKTPPYQDWGVAPDITTFYGREEELATLEQWIVKEQCRMVALLGMGGIGKTTLSIRNAKQIQEQFDYVIWRSLRHTPKLTELLGDWLAVLSQPEVGDFTKNSERAISQLIECLRQHHCLLILDDVEAIMRSGVRVGRYQVGYENYGELLRRVAQEPHRSCLMLSSAEKPREIALLEAPIQVVRSLPLTGLKPEEARYILQEKGLTGEKQWEELIQNYRGNPLALKIVATTIQDLFSGNVTEFAKHKTLVINDLFFEILEQHFQRLSELEKEVMKALAKENKPISLLELRQLLAINATSELIEALTSLEWRSLTEKIEKSAAASKETLFTLQPVIKKYVTKYHCQ